MLEHDEDDQLITRATFQENRYDADLQFATDTNDFFRRLDEMKSRREGLPAVMLLAYHSFPMPTVAVLRRIKADEACRHIPVVVLSTAMPAHLVRECYAEGAASVILKPHTNEGVRERIGSFFQYWFNTASLG